MRDEATVHPGPGGSLEAQVQDPSNLPLCVDLDGTLVRTDTLHENLLLLLRTSPGRLLAATTKLFGGIAPFKRAVASEMAIRADLLPYHQEFVEFLNHQASQKRRLLLVTAADRNVADGVATHLGIFEAVLASDGSKNLKARVKAEEIRNYLSGGSFAYAGDSPSDIPVWKAASAAILVNSNAATRRAVTGAGVPISNEFPRGKKFWAFVQAMRVYQWAKNLLIFVPLLLSHSVTNFQKLSTSLEAFGAFCLAASAIYIVNDLLDLDSDRQHVRKRRRPFASGTVTISQGLLLAIVLLAISFLVCLRLPVLARAMLAMYLVTSVAYSLVLKRMVFLDVITLAGLYTVRLMFGGLAARIVISPWTLAFSIFFFLSLATCKRLSELRAGGMENHGPLPGRAYSQTDLSSLTSIATSSAYVAMLILALYVNSPEVIALYRRPRLLWLLVPVLTYWVSRMIMKANRGDMHDDPIVFAFGDRSSRIAGLVVAAIVVAAV
jgi:4-hydroxybenzoate polyprenyltransferase